MLSIIKTGLLKYKKTLLIIFGLLIVLYILFYIKDKYDYNKINKNQEIINSLNNDINNLKGQKEQLSKENQINLDNYNEAKKIADSYKAKVDSLINNPPVVITDGTPIDCIEPLKALAAQYNAREILFVADINKLTAENEEAAKLIASLEETVTIDNNIIAKFDIQTDLYKKQLDNLYTMLNKETTRKIIYRTIVVVEGVVIIVIMLL